MTMHSGLYAFVVNNERTGSDRGWRYVRRLHVNGETRSLPIHEQSAYRFGSMQEAIVAGEEWAEGANGRLAARTEEAAL